ncbi:MAG: NAD kinase [Longicatena sp.]
MKYAIVAKKDEKSYQVEQKIRQRLDQENWDYDKANPKLVICVGGDGTLLYGVHQYLHCINDLHFLGIHTGTLGFFTDYTEKELDVCIDDILHKEPKTFESKLLKIKLDNYIEPFYALNEIRIENIIKSQILEIYVDNEFFETCRGSGVCISTQAGSTAYNRSLRGAVIDSGLSLIQLAEITPIQHSKHRSLANPYIMMENRTIKMTSNTFDTAVLCYDHLNLSLEKTNEIICMMSDLKVRFARYREYSYLDRLKNLY